MSQKLVRVGDLRPTQILHTFGVGSLVDLPNFSVMVMGLGEWDVQYGEPISEPRLLAAAQRKLGPQLKQLLGPPIIDESEIAMNPFEQGPPAGVPVATFPRWMVCPACRRLASLGTGMFHFKRDPFRQDRNCFVHVHCPATKQNPTVFPARFMVACRRGHLDDFPWNLFVHKSATGCPGPLRFEELGPSGEARDVRVRCDTCGAGRAMAQAFGERGRQILPICRGRRVHLRDDETEPCEEDLRTILIGASNLWFPASISVLSVPRSADELEQLVEELWEDHLQHADSMDILKAFLQTPQLRRLSKFDPEKIWEAMQRRQVSELDEEPEDLKLPEWNVFSNPKEAPTGSDFKVNEVAVPREYQDYLKRVVLVERLREVQALTGFTRIESPVDIQESEEELKDYVSPLSRSKPTWIPASQVRGEGIFLQFREQALAEWRTGSDLNERLADFFDAHRKWRKMRGLEPLEAGFPGLRFILLHSFSHALMRELTLECGYSAASVRERIYAREANQEGGPMAGVLLYTAAPDSEGTLGGLIELGKPENLGRYLDGALANAAYCASDPLCSEHPPSQSGRTLHAACCHACLFASETSCEKGNRYLDRALLVDTVGVTGLGFFDR